MKRVVVLPCAGLGTRVGAPESKEMLPDKYGQPLILHWIKWAETQNAKVHIITRKEKVSLIEFVKNFSYVSVQFVSSTNEWYESVLKTHGFWSDYNFLALPDTRMKPQPNSLKESHIEPRSAV